MRAGGAPTQLTKIAGEYLNPVWSPDGSTIVFVAGSGATARGQMMAENPYYELRSIPATGGESRFITAVNPPSGRLSHRRHIVQPSFGPDGRVVYPEMLQVNNEWRTEVRSIRLDGSERRTLATIPESDEAVLSPDGRWLAFEEGDNVFLVTMPQFGIGGRPIELKREDKPLWPLSPLSREGGNFPRWSGPTTLVFGSANENLRARRGHRRNQSITACRFRCRAPRVKGSVVFRNARIVTMKGDEVIESGDLVVTDGRIAAVGPSGGVTVPAGAASFDAKGKTIVPGFVDMHTHNHRSPSGTAAPARLRDGGGARLRRDLDARQLDVVAEHLSAIGARRGRRGRRPARVQHRRSALRRRSLAAQRHQDARRRAA